MKRFITLSILTGLVAATPSLCLAQTDADTGAVAAVSARAEIQAATDDLNAALLRGDAAGALKWLAPDFVLSKRQYLVQDLAWMKTALPLQLERGRFDKLTTPIERVTLRDEDARVNGKVDIEAEWKPNVTKIGARKFSGYGIEGTSEAKWRRTPEGPRLVEGNYALKALWFLEPPAPSIAPQLAVKGESPAAAAGLTVQEPVAVFEVNSGGNDHSLAFAPDSARMAWVHSSGEAKFGVPQTGAAIAGKASSLLLYQVAFDRSGALWTSDSDGIVRRWDADDNATLLQKWEVARRFSNYRFSVAPDGSKFAVMNGNDVKLWDAEQGKVADFKPNFAFTTDVEFSPDSARLAVFSNKSIEVRDAKDGALIHTFAGELWAGFLADGQTMVTVATNAAQVNSTSDIVNSALRFRSVVTGEIERESPIPNLDKPDRKAQNGATMAGEVGYYTVQNPLISPDGKVAIGLYRRDEGGQIGVWNARNGELMRMLRGFSTRVVTNVATIRFSPDSQQLAVSSGKGEIALWDVSTPPAKPEPPAKARQRSEVF